MFALGKVLDAFFHVVADGADSDLAVLIGSRFPIKGFHQGVGEEVATDLRMLGGSDSFSNHLCIMTLF